MEPYKNAIMELFIEQELLMAAIYQSLAEQFPQHVVFWSTLASEELEHAGWAKHLQQLAKDDKVEFDEGKTRTYTVRALIDYIRTVEREVATRITLDRAFAITVDLERSLIEKNAYSRFHPQDGETREILAILQKGMDDHLTRVTAYVAQYQRTRG